MSQSYLKNREKGILGCTVDGMLVNLDLESGEFNCELTNNYKFDYNHPSTSTFLGKVWNYDSRPLDFFAAPGILDCLFALFGLLNVLIVFRLLPFRKFLNWVECPICLKAPIKKKILARRMTAAYNLLPLLPWCAECLEVSALITRWGRNLGMPTQLIIGVRTAPFAGHAWCQFEGEVINDSSDVKKQFVCIYESYQTLS